MLFHKAQPVDSFENLRSRIERLFRTSARRGTSRLQMSLDLSTTKAEPSINYPSKNIYEFIEFMTDALPDGNVYLFGGVLRDMALLGRKGFNSDIDVVVDGDWHYCIPYLDSLGARKNKFGGYRFEIAGWPIDIWHARETWAIKQGLVTYRSIASLTETTVLNWDSILMNWRTRSFISRNNYLEEINNRMLSIVLEKNPNPLGMAVRVFRHLCTKDAKRISISAIEYLANTTNLFTFNDIKISEIHSYGNSVIELATYRFFERLKQLEYLEINERFNVAIDYLEKEGVSLSHWQRNIWAQSNSSRGI